LSNLLVSTNNQPNRAEFDSLLFSMLTFLNHDAASKRGEYSKLLGSKLEGKVFEVLTEKARGTVFENSIELISGQRFPDIIAQKYYGVEVKSTKSNHWKSTGGSIAEGTRIDGIERIFMLFGKMVHPIKFKCRPYEECLSEVVVTHSPRYLIDMELRSGETIFDKINLEYDDLRQQENPIKTILDYYKKQLKGGEKVWWLESDTPKSSNIIIRLWNNLPPEERDLIMLKGCLLFPELVSKRQDKFNAFAIWLSTRQGVVCPNVRDIFTAGGQGRYIFRGQNYAKIPHILTKLLENADRLSELLAELSAEELSETWMCRVNSNDKAAKWLDLISENAQAIIKNDLPLKRILSSKIN
jgi:hypothetical protein